MLGRRGGYLGPERFQQSVESRSGDCGNPEEGEPELARVPFERRNLGVVDHGIHLRRGDDLGFCRQCSVEQPQLAAQHVEVRHRLAA